MKRALALAVVLLAGCQGMASWGERPQKQRYESRPPSMEGKAPAPRGGENRRLPVQEPIPANGRYTVRRDDTLYSIAFRYGLDYREVAAWNGIGRSYAISPGQELRLTPPPGSRPLPEPSAPVVVARPPERKPKPARTPQPPMLPSDYRWETPTKGPVVARFADNGKGLDYSGSLGQPVFAAAPGKVVYSGNALKGYGELIIIKHDERYLSAYGYNQRRYVVEGDIVTAGQPIGELGLGPENKPLLHFEIRERGQPVNPEKYLPRG